MYAERVRQSRNDRQRRIAASALYATHVSQVDFGVVRELLLRKLPLDPQPLHICADNLVPVHRPDWSRATRYSLGTIVPIQLTGEIGAAVSRHVRRLGP